MEREVSGAKPRPLPSDSRSQILPHRLELVDATLIVHPSQGIPLAVASVIACIPLVFPVLAVLAMTVVARLLARGAPDLGEGGEPEAFVALAAGEAIAVVARLLARGAPDLGEGGEQEAFAALAAGEEARSGGTGAQVNSYLVSSHLNHIAAQDVITRPPYSYLSNSFAQQDWHSIPCCVKQACHIYMTMFAEAMKQTQCSKKL